MGTLGEDAAASFLIAKGWQVLERNLRYREGEIDLVCCKHGVLCFVEVKTRRSRRAGTGAEAVTATKQARIRRAAIRYLSERDLKVEQIRFDVIDLRVERGEYLIKHLEAAF